MNGVFGAPPWGTGMRTTRVVAPSALFCVVSSRRGDPGRANSRFSSQPCVTMQCGRSSPWRWRAEPWCTFSPPPDTACLQEGVLSPLGAERSGDSRAAQGRSSPHSERLVQTFAHSLG